MICQRKHQAFVALMVATLSLSGCAATLGPVSAVRAPGLCQPPSPQAGAVLLDVSSISATEPLADQVAVHGGSLGYPMIKDGFHYVRVNMGQKPSGGYRMVPLSETLQKEGSVAVMSVDWISPAADSMTIQAITYPCLILELPKGDYSSIELRDGDAKLRHRLEM